MDLSNLIEQSGIQEPELIGYLPYSLKELNAYINLVDIIYIVERIGGIKIQIPFTIKPDSFLALHIGKEKADALAKAYKGECIYIPKALSLEYQLKRKIVFRLHKQGLSIMEIALKLKISDRTVHKYLNQPKGNHEELEHQSTRRSARSPSGGKRNCGAIHLYQQAKE